MRLADRVVIVTGASRGIGAAAVAELARRDAHVVAAGRDSAALTALSAQTGAHPVVADLREEAAADQLVEAALDTFGGLDAVIANAGVGYAGPFARMPAELVDQLVAINLTAPLRLARAALPVLLAASVARKTRNADGGTHTGALVFVTSIAGLVGVPNEAVYSATKAATETFAAVLRDELHGTGITVSTFAPGVVATDFFTTRGAPYARRFPRPMRPQRAARGIVELLESGAPQRIEPRWLAVPARLAAAAPRSYRALARRFS